MFAPTLSAVELDRRARMAAALPAVNAEVSRLTDPSSASSCNYATTAELAGASTVVDVRRTFEVRGRARRLLNLPARRVTGHVVAHVDVAGHVSFVRPQGGVDVAAMRRLGLR